MATGRPYQALSDAELDKRIQHNLSAMTQTYNQSQTAAQQATNQLQQQVNLAKSSAAYSGYLAQTVQTAGTSITFNPGSVWTVTSSTPIYFDSNTGVFESKADRKLREKVDKVFKKLHKQVSRELASA